MKAILLVLTSDFWLGIALIASSQPQEQGLDKQTKKKLEQLINQLAEDNPKACDGAQKELGEFLDNDTKAEFVKKMMEKGKDTPSVKETIKLFLIKKVHEII